MGWGGVTSGGFCEGDLGAVAQLFHSTLTPPLPRLPQTNVYQGAQKRKIGQFEMFKRKAVVVIPPHHELRKRTSRRSEETGSSVPLDVINAMKGGCGLVA